MLCGVSWNSLTSHISVIFCITLFRVSKHIFVAFTNDYFINISFFCSRVTTYKHHTLIYEFSNCLYISYCVNEHKMNTLPFCLFGDHTGDLISGSSLNAVLSSVLSDCLTSVPSSFWETNTVICLLAENHWCRLKTKRTTDDPAVNVFFHTFLTGSHLMTR